MQAARHEVFNELGTVMASAFANGGYKQNPKAFPLHYMDFRGNKIVFEFGVYCPRARLYLGELLQTYRRHLPAAHQELPELSIDD